MPEPMPLGRTDIAARFAALAAACLALAAGCNSGLDKYNDQNDNGIPDDQETEPEEPDRTDDTTPEEDCAAACAAALAEMGDTPGCTVECGIDILHNFSGSVTNVTPLSEGGPSCEIVLSCDTPCGVLLGECINALPQPPSSELLSMCTAEYRECLLEENCFSALMTCEEGASDLLQTCIDSGEPLDYCQALYDNALCTCGELYTACLGGTPSACDEPATTAAMLLPPVQTGPSRFRIPRSTLDRELERLGTLSTEIFVLPAFDRAGKPLGFELRSIRGGDRVHTLGLRNGDVLLAVNGKPLVQGRGVDEWLALYASKQVRLTIRRAGSVRQLTYDITQ